MRSKDWAYYIVYIAAMSIIVVAKVSFAAFSILHGCHYGN
jgi:hypothetical protein